jgi:hypothetical protein
MRAHRRRGILKNASSLAVQSVHGLHRSELGDSLAYSQGRTV